MNINDREKVMRGLETCIQSGTPEDCDECPYRECGNEVVPCLRSLLTDALDLLREEEPRVMEFLELNEITTYWIEDNHEANMQTSCIPETIMDIMGDRVFTIPVVKLLNGYAPVISKNREGYGKTWRAWTSRPTDEQRKAVEWDA